MIYDGKDASKSVLKALAVNCAVLPKVISAKSPRDAEDQLDFHAAQGWEVKAMTTFEKRAWRIVTVLEKQVH